MLGGVWDQELLDQLYAHALTYLHGHSVGGTNPSLLRAIGAGTAIIAFDVTFNRDVLGDDGVFFDSVNSVGDQIMRAEATEARQRDRGLRLQQRASERYDWDDVAALYENLARRLADGATIRGIGSRRRRDSEWSAQPDSHAQTAEV